MASFSPRSFFSSPFSPASFGARWECEGDALVIDMVPSKVSERALEPGLINWWSAAEDEQREVCARYLDMAQRACELVLLWRTGAHRLGAARSPFKGVPQDVHALLIPLLDSARTTYFSLLTAEEQRLKEELAQLVLGRCLMVLLYASRIEISSDFYRFGIASPLPSSVDSQLRTLDNLLVNVDQALDSLAPAENGHGAFSVARALYSALDSLVRQLDSFEPDLRFCVHTLVQAGLNSLVTWARLARDHPASLHLSVPVLKVECIDWDNLCSTTMDNLDLRTQDIVDSAEYFHAYSAALESAIIASVSLTWDDIRSDACATLAALSADILTYDKLNNPTLSHYWAFEYQDLESRAPESEFSDSAHTMPNRLYAAEPWRLDLRQDSRTQRQLSCTLRVHSRLKDLPPFIPAPQTLRGSFIGSTLS